MLQFLFCSKECADTVAVNELVYILGCCAVHYDCGDTHTCCDFCRVNLCYHTACTSVGTCAAAESSDIICDFSDNRDKSCVGVFVGVIIKKAIDIREDNKCISLDKLCNDS